MKEVSRTLAPLFHPVALVRASKIRIGKRIRVEGIPAILVGVATIIAAARISRALPALSEVLHHAKLLLEAARESRRPLRP